MDDLEKQTRTKPDQREEQFMRLRDPIEERAASKFLAYAAIADAKRLRLVP